MTITILTKNRLKFIYRNVIRYRFEGNKIIIDNNDGILDQYVFDKIAGFIIKGKLHGND